MSKKLIATVYLCALSMSSISAFAEHTAMSSSKAPSFDAIDVDHDAFITKEEASKSKDAWLVKSFDTIDTNKDGVLSKAEYADAKAKSS